VFDGTGSPARTADVVVENERIVAVGPDPNGSRPGDRIIDCQDAVIMPGMVDGHAHLTFPSAEGALESGFNPPLDISYFFRDHPGDEVLAVAERNAAILLDAGFTSAYSAGSLLPGDAEVRLRERIESGRTPGPRLRACSMERDNQAATHGTSRENEAADPASVYAFVSEMAEAGFDNVKLLLSNDDVFVPGGSQMTQYTESEAAAAQDAAASAGVFLNAHAQAAQAVKLAVRYGFRAIYHCSYADEEAIDLLEASRDRVFVGPALGIMWANVYEGEDFGIDHAQAERMGSVAALEAMTALYPELHRRGIRIVVGGDYGFPNNPIGKQARDLELFVKVFGFRPEEALQCATSVGAELMGRGDELGRVHKGYLADLLVVRGDPTIDVSVLQDRDNLIAIMQGGVFHKGPLEMAGSR
jgi:imidazolonepropionase-like amidohydrolase